MYAKNIVEVSHFEFCHINHTQHIRILLYRKGNEEEKEGENEGDDDEEEKEKREVALQLVFDGPLTVGYPKK